MRELFRTDEGNAAWRNPGTAVDARRLLGALVQPQPESHLRMVLGGDGEILLESLVRRGWVEWREMEPAAPAPSVSVPAASEPPTSGYPPAAARTPPPGPSALPGPRAAPVPPPPVSPEQVEQSLDDFFRRMSS
jgi:hypothetical protein